MQFLRNCFVLLFPGAGPNRNPARTRPASMARGNFFEIEQARGNFLEIEQARGNFFEIANDENYGPTRPLTLLDFTAAAVAK